jgi:peptidyl-lysine (3S)-dioxygenase / protease
MSLWTDDYLTKKLDDSEISVNVTPNGRGDAVLDNAYFVMPEERRMTFSDFLSKLKTPQPQGGEQEVFYLSHQDDSLRTQFPALLPDVDPTIRFAEDALGTPPDAINLWMGGADAVTTMHMDHYENLYAVVRGEKRFTLLPPTSMPLLYPRPYEPRVYSREGGSWHTRPAPSPGHDSADGAGRRHTWISVNPEAPDLER